MYITHTEAEGTKIFPEKKPPQQEKDPSLISVSLHHLQDFISNIYNGCSLPPLDEFLDLELDDENVRIKVKHYKNPPSQEQSQNNEYIYFIVSGRVFLKKDEDLHEDETPDNQIRALRQTLISSHKQKNTSTLPTSKLIQIKENNFFILNSFKPKKENGERKIINVEKLKIQSLENGELGRCLIGKIKITDHFGADWYRSESEKYSFISSVINNNTGDISEHKLKGLSRFFKFEKFRRGTSLIREDQVNERMYFLASGQCQISKNLVYLEGNHQNVKNIKIANSSFKSVFGSQFLLFDFSGQSRISIIAAMGLQSSFKNQNIRLQVNSSSSNCNFTISVLSAFAEVYYISVSKFKDLCQKYVPQVPFELRKHIQNGYVTILRNLKQKISLEEVKFSRNNQNKSESRKLFEAKVESEQCLQKKKKEDIQAIIPDERKVKKQLNVKKSELIETKMQGGYVEKTRKFRLQKKIEMLMGTKKDDIDYKKKIQNLMKEKLAPTTLAVREEDEDHSKSISSLSKSPQKNRQIVKDLNQIFMNKDDGTRTLSIQRQNDILSKKETLLKKRYSTNNVLIVNEDSFNKNKNKLFRMDLIRKGALDLDEELRMRIKMQSEKKKLDIAAYSTSVKKQCVSKINKANKIKQQFMTIKSECEHCHCYDNIEGLYESTTQKDFKAQTMKTGSAWKISDSRNTTAEEPLQKLHSRTKFLSEKSATKYEHNKHLISKKKGMVSSSHRRLSAPQIC